MVEESTTFEINISILSDHGEHSKTLRKDIFSFLAENNYGNVCEGFIAEAEFTQKQLDDQSWQNADILVYVDDQKKYKELVNRLNLAFGSSIKLSMQLLDNQIWQGAWQESFKPWESRCLSIIPYRQQHISQPLGKTTIVIKEGDAFGTGQHATTEACILQLENSHNLFCQKKVFDFGTGTGILLIAAAKLGAKAVAGNDLDEEIIRTCNENLVLNEIRGAEVWLGENLERKNLFDYVIINVLFPHTVRLMGEALSYGKSSCLLMTSGYNLNNRNNIIQQAASYGFSLMEAFDVRGWCSDLFTRQT